VGGGIYHRSTFLFPFLAPRPSFAPEEEDDNDDGDDNDDDDDDDDDDDYYDDKEGEGGGGAPINSRRCFSYLDTMYLNFKPCSSLRLFTSPFAAPSPVAEGFDRLIWSV
jgi:hypothetical protein